MEPGRSPYLWVTLGSCWPFANPFGQPLLTVNFRTFLRKVLRWKERDKRLVIKEAEMVA
jgi:hypothetical protein